MADLVPQSSSSRDPLPVPVGHNFGISAASPTRLTRLYTTSDVRAATGLSRTHLDFYLREGLVLPNARTESGFLLFDDSEVELLRSIVSERRDGVPLKDIRLRIGR